jgi:hypothetical protein
MTVFLLLTNLVNVSLQDNVTLANRVRKSRSVTCDGHLEDEGRDVGGHQEGCPVTLPQRLQ